MDSAVISIRKGERRPVYGQVDAGAGSTITLLPGGTGTLYDNTGAAVAGITGVAVTGYDSAAIQKPRAWYTLDSSGLTAGALYRFVFTFQGTGSDGITRTFEPSALVCVLS